MTAITKQTITIEMVVMVIMMAVAVNDDVVDHDNAENIGKLAESDSAI